MIHYTGFRIYFLWSLWYPYGKSNPSVMNGKGTTVSRRVMDAPVSQVTLCSAATCVLALDGWCIENMKDCRRRKDLPDYKRGNLPGSFQCHVQLGKSCGGISVVWTSHFQNVWSKSLTRWMANAWLQLRYLRSSNDRLNQDHFHRIKEGIASGEDNIKLAGSGGKELGNKGDLSAMNGTALH